MDDILNDLYQLAYDSGIGVILNRTLSSDTPSMADTETNQILINLNQPGKERQLPFQVAHEIQHVLHRDRSAHPLAFDSMHSDPQMELATNRRALRMLLPYYVDERNIDNYNFLEFMNYFMIPAHLEKTVIEEFRNYI